MHQAPGTGAGDRTDVGQARACDLVGANIFSATATGSC